MTDTTTEAPAAEPEGPHDSLPYVDVDDPINALVAVDLPDSPLWMQDVKYPARIDRQLIGATWSEGVLSGLGLRQRAEGVNLSVDVLPGFAVVAGDDQAGQGSYVVTIPGKLNIALDGPSASPRIDVIALYVNDPQAGGRSGTPGTVDFIKGTPSASPVAPAVPNTAIELGRVTVAVGAANITDAAIDTQYRSRSGPRSLSGLILVFGSNPQGADYPRDDGPQAISSTLQSLAFKLTERSIVRFDAHMSVSGSITGHRVVMETRLKAGTAAVDANTKVVGYARATLGAAGGAGAASLRSWVVLVLDPGDYRVGLWGSGTTGYQYNVMNAAEPPQLIATMMGPTSRPVTPIA